MPGRTPTQPTRQAIIDSAQLLMARKGYSAVGLNEILERAHVPKGSFYHYFPSKEAAGEAVMQDYFLVYLAAMDRIFAETELPAAQRLTNYFEQFRETQSLEDCQGRCLAVKLGAEVADLSESMRIALKAGISSVVDRLEVMVGLAVEDGSITTAQPDPRAAAEALYSLWVGASVIAKINRHPASFETARRATSQLLGS